MSVISFIDIVICPIKWRMAIEMTILKWQHGEIVQRVASLIYSEGGNKRSSAEAIEATGFLAGANIGGNAPKPEKLFARAVRREIVVCPKSTSRLKPQ